jgi:hypothetical protein
MVCFIVGMVVMVDRPGYERLLQMAQAKRQNESFLVLFFKKEQSFFLTHIIDETHRLR